MECKDDDKAFIFTLKNPHGVEPTRYKKYRNDYFAIVCNTNYGPSFIDDMFIGDNCNRENSCWVSNNDGTHGYECHPEYKSSLFVNTAKPDEENLFTVSDYEVYCIDNYKEYIDHLCNHPDIIWRYIETRDISEESLKQFNNDTELLNDLDAIQCDDSVIRLKISHYYFKNPSEFLPNTRLVNQQYDDKLREWLGSDHQWRLLYRASEHGYTGSSFHECCDDVKGPTLVIIKSSRGWIFGGYTTQSWQVVHPDEDGGIY